jgi:hypothetical protein
LSLRTDRAILSSECVTDKGIWQINKARAGRFWKLRSRVWNFRSSD